MATFQQQAQQVVSQFNADTINFLAASGQATRKKSWRPLGMYNWITLGTQQSWAIFYKYLLVCAETCAPDRKFVQFSVLVIAKERKTGEELNHELFVAAPYAALTAGLDRATERRRELILETQATKEGDPRPVRDREMAAQLAFDAQWKQTLSIDTLVGQRVACAQLTIDRQSKTMLVEEAPVISTDPGDYPDHASTTSEILAVLAAKLVKVIHTTNLDWALKNYALMKFLMFTMDSDKFDFGDFRVNVDDEEEWDFIYPQFDDALAARQPR